MNGNDIARFWSRVAIAGQAECWLWQGGGRRNGYGAIKIGGRMYSTHRIAYELKHGTTPPRTMFVMHTCDIKKCVNPGHLVLGTSLDNVRDRDSKGRQSRGEAHYKTKLTNSDIEMIRSERSNGVPREVFVKMFNLSLTSITRITSGEDWKHIPNRSPFQATHGSGHPMAKLTEAVIPVIRDHGQKGIPVSIIAREFGVAKETIRRILTGKRWRHVA
jgi:hypothetical protein